MAIKGVAFVRAIKSNQTNIAVGLIGDAIVDVLIVVRGHDVILVETGVVRALLEGQLL
jgi:hypothetical protein